MLHSPEVKKPRSFSFILQQQLRQLGDVDCDAPRFVAGQQVCHRPAAGSSAACSSTLLVRAAVY
jgi:hypothetical protein